jgi:hypothetical protein
MVDTDNDGTFFDESIGVGILQMYDDGTNGDVTANDFIYSRNNINFPTSGTNKDAKFTIGTRVQGPGGITTNLTLWLSASDVDADGSAGNNPVDGALMSNNATAGYTPTGTYWVDRSPTAYNIDTASSTYTYQ